MGWVQRGGVLTQEWGEGYSARDWGGPQQRPRGAGLAISGDGAVLAVGATQDPYGSDESIFIFDAAAESWALRGHIVAADAAPYPAHDWFGEALSLSGNGHILDVGAPTWDALQDQGAVYRYAWVGAWALQNIQSSVYPLAGDQFGAMVSMASDGLARLVFGDSGANFLEIQDYAVSWVMRGYWIESIYAATMSSDGMVMFLQELLAAADPRVIRAYDRAGTGWSLRGTIPVDTPPGASRVWLATDRTGSRLAAGFPESSLVITMDWAVSGWTEVARVSSGEYRYGERVALTDDGATLAVTGYQSRANDFLILAVYTYDYLSGPETYTPTFPITLDVVAPYTPRAAITLDVALSVHTPTAPLILDTAGSVSRYGAATFPITLQVHPTFPWGVRAWRPIVTLAGNDISPRITGEISIEHEAGTARIAELVWAPPSGSLTPGDLVGQTLTIDVESDSGGTITIRRRFTGRIETPAVDLAAGTVRLLATDGRTAWLDGLSTAEIDAITPDCAWSSMIFTGVRTGADYAADRLSTWPGDLDLSVGGTPRATPWAAGTVYRTLALHHIVDGSVGVDFADRSRLVNQVTITWAYRFPLLSLRRARWQWDMESGASNHPSLSASYHDYWHIPAPGPEPVQAAADGTGWALSAATYTTATDRYPGGFGVSDYHILAADLRLDLRYAQTVTETYTLTVEAPASIAVAGAVPRQISYSGESDFDADAWEADPALTPSLTLAGATGEASTSGALGDYGRTAANAAIATALHAARTDILDSHRHSVGVTIPLDPDLDTHLTLAVDTARVTATGRIGHLREVMDTQTGRAIQTVTIRPFGIDSEADPVTESDLDVPAAPDLPAPDLTGLSLSGITQYPWADSAEGYAIDPPDPDLDGWITPTNSGAGYSGQFRITAPAIPDADREALDLPVSATYTVAIPEDGLTLSI